MLEGGGGKYRKCVRCVRSDWTTGERELRAVAFGFLPRACRYVWLAVCRVVVSLLDVAVRPQPELECR